MKNIFLLIALFVMAASVNAQKKTTPKPKTPTTKSITSPLKTLQDSASYAIGMSVMGFYKQQGISKLNAALVTRAMTDVMNNKPLLLDDAKSNSVIMACINS